MQSKINSFFKPCTTKPSEPSCLLDLLEDTPLFDTTHEPEILITYSRRTPNSQPCSNNETDSEDTGKQEFSSASVDALVKPGSSSGKVLNKKRNYAQLYLELGQNDFHLHNCSVCGLKYARGYEVEEKVHKEFHKNYTHGIPFKGWRTERVVPMNLGDSSRIILVLDSDPSAQKNKVREVALRMEGELGLSEGWLLHEHCKVYLFICAQRISGCLVAEPITSGNKVIPSSGSHKQFHCSTTKASRSISSVLQFGNVNFKREVVKRATCVEKNELIEDHNGAIFFEEQDVPATCGIRAIWVAPSYRRKHVATKLLNATRESFYTDCVLERSQLAFSQPTSAGKALASSYCGTNSFLVYNTGSRS